MESVDFNLAIDGVPFMVKATPVYFNSDRQYNVIINGSNEVLFSFDPSLGRYAAVGDDAINVPDNVEIEIGSRLNTKG